MKNQVLSIEQMQKLKELGVDTSKASMVCLFQDDESNIYDWDEVVEECSEFGDCFHHFVKDDEGNNNRVYMSLLDAEGGNYDHSYRKDCTVFTLQDITELLTDDVQKAIVFINNEEYFVKCYEIKYDEENVFKIIYFDNIKQLLNACYEMLIWVAENGYLKTK